jgi:rhomboid family GlyGly-CTERM serine protease
MTMAAQRLSHATGGWQWQRSEFMAGAWWQLITSQWVHFNVPHAAMNVAAMVLMLFAFDRLVERSIQLAALSGGYAGVAMALVSDASCDYYAGASGALHGFLAGSALALVVCHQPNNKGARIQPRNLGLVVVLALVLKLLSQHASDGPPALNWLGFTTYPLAHEAGSAAGMLAVALLLALRWCRSRPQ